MSNELLIRSTYFPEDKLSERRWLRHIAGKDLNLSEINESTILGACIIGGYETDPEGTVNTVRELYVDNPELMTRVIGINNVRKIIL